MNDNQWRRHLEAGVTHIAAHDEKLQPYTLLFPLPSFQPHTKHYQELVESIISQQLSVKAAAAITKRFVELFGGHFPEPQQILEKDFEELRSTGLSRPKTTYIRDLAAHVLEGKLTFDHIDQMTNDEIISMLTDVKGIGEWTAHMFLIFSMGRLDVLAHGDLGIKNGIKELYGFDHVPMADDIKAISTQHHWAPYQSVACWYVWKSLDNEPMA